MKSFTFPKSERMVSLKLQDALFHADDSQAAAAFPLRAVWRLHDATEGPSVQILISAPKKRLRHAVDRNRAKRQMREAWRLNNQQLKAAIPEGKQLLIALLWLATEPQPSTHVSQKLGYLLSRIARQISNPQP